MKVTVDGKEMEVLTAEEAATKAEEAATAAIEKYQAEHPDQTAEFTKLQADLKTANDALEAGKGGNDGQIRRLKEAKEEAEKNLTEGLAKMQGDFEKFKTEIVGDVKEALLAKYAGTNKELREKITIEFNNYKPNDTSKAGIEERMAKAYQLVSGKPAPRVFDNLTGAGSRGDAIIPAAEAKETENGAAMRKVLGISDDQMKKAQEILKKNK